MYCTSSFSFIIDHQLLVTGCYPRIDAFKGLGQSWGKITGQEQGFMDHHKAWAYSYLRQPITHVHKPFHMPVQALALLKTGETRNKYSFPSFIPHPTETGGESLLTLPCINCRITLWGLAMDDWSWANHSVMRKYKLALKPYVMNSHKM